MSKVPWTSLTQMGPKFYANNNTIIFDPSKVSYNTATNTALIVGHGFCNQQHVSQCTGNFRYKLIQHTVHPNEIPAAGLNIPIGDGSNDPRRKFYIYGPQNVMNGTRPIEAYVSVKQIFIPPSMVVDVYDEKGVKHGSVEGRAQAGGFNTASLSSLPKGWYRVVLRVKPAPVTAAPTRAPVTTMPLAENETTVARGGTKIGRRGLSDVMYHIFDKPGKHTFTVKHKIPVVEYLVVGAHGGSPGGSTPGGGGQVVKGATTKPLEPGEYVVEVGKIGGKVETKVTMVNCMQNADTCKKVPYTQYMVFPNGSGYRGVPSGTYLSCGNVRSTPTKMTEEVYAAGGKSSFDTVSAKGGNPGAIKPYMVSTWQETMGRYGGRTPGSSITMSAQYPRNQYEYAFPGFSYASNGKTHGVNPLYTSWSCGQFNMSYRAGTSASGQGGTRYENCCAWAGQPQDRNCCTNASGGAGGSATRPSTGKSKPGAGIFSNITGENVEYGHGSGGNVDTKPSKHGIVILAYNLKNAESNIGPSAEEIDAIVAEYEQKMQQLKTAVQREKDALVEENKAALLASQEQQDALIAELGDLKNRYDTLKQKSDSDNQEIQEMKISNEENLVNMKNEYDAKMKAYKAAKEQELALIKEQNMDLAEANKSEQAKLVAEMMHIKGAYDALMQTTRACPVVPIGTYAKDAKTGRVLYKLNETEFQLVPENIAMTMDSTSYPNLENCLVSSLPFKTSIDLYVFIQAETWMDEGSLRVLSEASEMVVADFEFMDLSQVWGVENGKIRNAKSGNYLDETDCEISSSPSDETNFEIVNVSGNEVYIKSPCGFVTTNETSRITFSGSSSSWYMIRVGGAMA